MNLKDYFKRNPPIYDDIYYEAMATMNREEGMTADNTLTFDKINEIRKRLIPAQYMPDKADYILMKAEEFEAVVQLLARPECLYCLHSPFKEDVPK